VAGSGDIVTGTGLYSAIVTALYHREHSGKGSYVTTSLLAEDVWSASVSIQAALCEATFFPLHDRRHRANAALNVYQTSDGAWFVLVVTPDKLAAVAKAIGRADLHTDARFSDPAKLVDNMPQLTAILDEVFGSQPMAHWYEVFSGVHVTFGAVREPQEVNQRSTVAIERSRCSARRRRRQAVIHDQQPDSGARRHQSAREARPGTWRAQRRGSQTTWVQRR
jgi:crotonobetainyl-CoA:carnitine CoA-transferase CaiB-like acyl-CoA transferase